MDYTNTYIGQDDIKMPYSLDAEQAVLGCVLVDPACIVQVQVHLRPENFFMPQHQQIFSAMVEIEAEGGKIDPLLLLERLKRDNVYDDAGGRKYLFQLAEMVPSTANVESYAKIVREKFYIRTLIGTSKEIIDEATQGEESADVLLDSAEQKIYDIRRGKTTSGPSRLRDIILNEVYDKLNKLTSPDKELYKGYTTGFSELDKALTGLNKSDLILVGARPAMGKTSFALNIARNVAVKARKKVLMFSLEMTKEQLAQRVLSTEARVEGFKMRTGDLDTEDWSRISAATAALSDSELYFDDSSNITVPEMKARIRRLKNVDCVIIDYLGLIHSGSRTENRVQEVSEITRSLKLMAKDLNIPVLCCAQLSRGTEGRGKSHRPQLADLRESGSIEQDADIVLMLYRDDYYAGEKKDGGGDGDDERGGAVETEANQVEVIVAKNRHGPTKTVYLGWDADHTLFTTIETIRDDM